MTGNSKILFDKFATFAWIGALSTAAQFATLGLLTDVLGINAVVASCSAYAGLAYGNYYLNRRFTFRSRAAHASALPRFVVVSLCGLLLNGALMALMVTGLHYNHWIAQVIATGIVLVMNFFGNLAWSFREART